MDVTGSSSNFSWRAPPIPDKIRRCGWLYLALAEGASPSGFLGLAIGSALLVV